MNFETIRGRTILFVLGQALLFAIAIVFTTLNVSSDLGEIRKNFREVSISKALVVGESQGELIVTALSLSQPGNEILSKMVKDPQAGLAWALVIGLDGSVIYTDDPLRSAVQTGKPLSEIALLEEEKTLLQQKGVHYIRSGEGADPFTETPSIRVTMPLTEPGFDERGEIVDRVKGYLLLGISQEALDEKLAAADRVTEQVVGWLVGLLAVIVVLNLAGYFTINRLFVQPVGTLQQAAEEIASGNLAADVAPLLRERKDEVGSLGKSFYQMGRSIRRVVESIRGSVGMVQGTSGDISKSARGVAQGSQSQNDAVQRTFRSMEEIGAAIGRIAENIDVLAASSDESSSSILELNAIIDEISENVEQLSAAVEDTTSSISQMTSSIHQVKENVEQLSVAADQTASSISEMDASIKQVEANAEQTVALAGTFSQEAQVGLEAVTQTAESIQKVHASSREAADVMQSLGERIEEIGKILNVIDDVAEQTNLLALNAAIIAAQAGEHGKSFAVVADEIKDLAERTAASTAEIAAIIRSLQTESERAISSVSAGARLVDEGVSRSQQAGDALRRIAESSRKATEMVREIARATVEQAKGSAQITAAIDKIVSMVLQINVATTEQAKGSTQIMGAAQKMKEITILVRGATREQSKGARQINEAMGRVIQMVDYINGAIKEQRGGSSQVVSEMETIRKIMEENALAATAMDEAAANLERQAEALGAEVRRFNF
ncbi:MAG: methyl-accepting chemotaxis protein [Bdellovibrionota bacterium]